MALASTIPPGVGARRLRALRARPVWRHIARGALGVQTLYWAATTGLLLLVAFPIELSFGGRVEGVTLSESAVWPVLLYIVGLPLALPVAAWLWIRTARAALDPDRQRWHRLVPVAAVVLFGLQLACWVPFAVTVSRD